MQLRPDSARTMEPSLCATSSIPHIHGDDRTHPSVLSLHAESELLHSHRLVSSVRPRGRVGLCTEQRNSMSTRAVNRKQAGGDHTQHSHQFNWEGKKSIMEARIHHFCTDLSSGGVKQSNKIWWRLRWHHVFYTLICWYVCDLLTHLQLK